MWSSNLRSSGHHIGAGGGKAMQQQEPYRPHPLDRLEYTVAALKGLGDLIGSASSLHQVGVSEFALLFGMLTDELESCAVELRRN
jgi:hypothetical protein